MSAHVARLTVPQSSIGQRRRDPVQEAQERGLADPDFVMVGFDPPHHGARRRLGRQLAGAPKR